ncbi:hypothetical protein Trydic_g10682 [Trypoxylus dichotomus]
MLSDVSCSDPDHYNPSIRTLEIDKQASGNCGFDLTRSKWDPYPWISSVEFGSAAYNAGLKNGDCVLEVNGEDIIGQRISDIANLVKKDEHVTLLLWNVGTDPLCSPEALCCGPMPTNLQRLTACMSSILNVLECPICLDTIPPPCFQCDNGHLICVRCKAKSEKCPVCRMKYNKARSILADHIYTTVSDVFGLKEETPDERSAKLNQIFKLKFKNRNIPGIKITTANSSTSKFFSKFNIAKSSSAENLSSNKHKSSTLSLDNEFNTNLKAKSLSTNEIFHVGPSVSRSNSATRINKCNSLQASSFLNTNERSLSCHGSYEFLNTTVNEEAQVSSNLLQAEVRNYRCPYEENCTFIITGDRIIEHFQNSHNGPLVQYFQSPIKLNLEDLLHGKHKTYLITISKQVFILKSTHVVEEGNVHLWLWFLGDKEIASQYRASSKIYNRENQELLSIHNSIYSLWTTSWQEIKSEKKGVILSETIMSAMISSGVEIVIEICISKL